ncbi:hypothetical protein [uncultured Rubinisphaera sp.]|uniref:hypothetical protein n=1 Tax=uncultured Rubinisphaera sp. TaxID=1678686 RepID=UPI0030D70E99|tara:strand:- start:1262 stop:2077 length:816 start_codon:yes stop_codon:yes gene_type:complete
MKTFCISLICVLFCYQTALATSVYFMPGDSLFHTTLPIKKIKELKSKPDLLRNHYARPANAPNAFCGYGGFPWLEITDLPEHLPKSLMKIYGHIRKSEKAEFLFYQNSDGKRASSETNAPHMFIYNRDYKTFGKDLGLKYNEDWMLPPGVEKSNGGGLTGPYTGIPVNMYEPFLDQPEAITRDWRNAKQIPGLRVDIPEEINWWYVGERIETPLNISFDDIKLVIIQRGRLADCFNSTNGAEFFVVDDKQIQYFRYSSSQQEWIEKITATD